MAIPLAGQFHYEVVLTKTPSGVWSGQTGPAASDALHPGLAGDRPKIELAGGVVTLRRTESPAFRVSFRVGDALEAVVEDRDLLCVSRGGTTDLAVTLFRQDDFVMGLGAIVGQRLGTNMTVEEDPRAREVELYHLAATLDRTDTTLVWLDASDPHVDATIGTLQHLPGPRLIVAIAGNDPEERRRLNQRVAQSLFGSTHTSHHYVDVASRFRTREQWIQYLRQLPKTRPRDLYIRFSLNGQDIDVRESEHAFNKPWHLFVAKVHTPGVPGEWSQLAIAREHRAITGQIVVDSTKLIASRHIDIAS